MSDDFTEVVRAHWKDTTGYLVAAAEPCLTIAHDEIRHVKRRLKRVALDDIAHLKPAGSWFMAIILCPGDDLESLASWGRTIDAERVHFYLHEDADPAQLSPWRDAGLSLARIELGVASWQSLHKLLGWDLNQRVYEDHAGM